jgi:hypothetical protein
MRYAHRYIGAQLPEGGNVILSTPVNAVLDMAGPVVKSWRQGTRALPWQLGLYNHSPAGPAWGYAGSGPAQSSLMVLADHFGRKTSTKARAGEMALFFHQPFKSHVVAALPLAWMLHPRVVDEFLLMHAAEQSSRPVDWALWRALMLERQWLQPIVGQATLRP